MISVVIELVVLLPLLAVKLIIFLKGVFSKKSKVRAEGAKIGLVIYDWVLESVYKKREKLKLAEEGTKLGQVLETQDHSHRKLLISTN